MMGRILLVAWLGMAGVLGQVLLPGKTAFDQFLPVFWSQNRNASNLVQGVNQNHGTNFWKWDLIPPALGPTVASNTFRITHATSGRPYLEFYNNLDAVDKKGNYISPAGGYIAFGPIYDDQTHGDPVLTIDPVGNIITPFLSHNRALVSGAGGIVAEALASSVEVNYLQGLGSNAQGQLDGKNNKNQNLADVADPAAARANINAVPQVATIAALKALSGTALTGTVFVLGYLAPGDGGGGQYNWKSADTSVTNNGSCFYGNSITSAGRWRLKHNGTVSVAQWGLVSGNLSTCEVEFQDLVNVQKLGTVERFARINFESKTTYTFTKTIDWIGAVVGGAPTAYGEFTVGGSGRVIGASIAPRLVFTDPAAVFWAFYLIKGLVIEGLSFEGPNVPSIALNTADNMSVRTNYLRFDGLQRNNRYSPQTALGFDCVHSTITISSNQYPSSVLTPYYTSITTFGGSARVTIRHCFFKNWVNCATISGASSAAVGPQNGEEFQFEKCYFTASDSATVWCQSQTRGCTMTECLVEQCALGINCLEYGAQQGAAPNVVGGSWVIMRTLWDIDATHGGFDVSGLQCEIIWQIGRVGFTAAYAYPVSIHGSKFEMAFGKILPNYHVAAVGGVVNFTGCTFGQLNASKIYPILFHETHVSNFGQGAIVLQNCVGYNAKAFPSGTLDMNATFPFYSNDPRKLIMKDCVVNTCEVMSDGASVPNLTSKVYYSQPGISFTVGSTRYMADPAAVYAPIGTNTTGAFSTGNFGGTLTLSGATGNTGLCKTNDFIVAPQQNTWVTVGYPANAFNTYVGTLTNIQSATVIDFTNTLTASVTGGDANAFLHPAIYWRPIIHAPCTATWFDSTTLTNISVPSAFKLGDRVRAANMVDGTWITAITGTGATNTYTLSYPMTGSGTGFAIYDQMIYQIPSVANGGVLSVSSPLFTDATGSVTTKTVSAAFDALSPNTTRGDISVRGVSGNVRLPVGAANTYLSGGTDPSYGQVNLASGVTGVLPISGGGSGQATAGAAFDALSPNTTRGDITVRGASGNIRLPLGVAGSSLVSNGTDLLARNLGNTAYFFADWITTVDGFSQVVVAPGTTLQVAGTAARPGIHAFSTSTGAAASACFIRGGVATPVQTGGGKITLRFGVQVPTLSTVSERFTARMGLTDQLTFATPVNGIHFDYTDTVNSGKWRGFVSIASVDTNCSGASGAPTVNAGQWYDLKIVIAANGLSTEFFVDGVSIGTVSQDTTAFTASVIIGIVKSIGTTDRRLWGDYGEFTEELTTARFSN